MNTNTCQVIPVIQTSLTRRGSGTSDRDPVRVITEYYSLKGDKLAENDPCERAITRKDLKKAWESFIELLDDEHPLVRTHGRLAEQSNMFSALVEALDL